VISNLYLLEGSVKKAIIVKDLEYVNNRSLGQIRIQIKFYQKTNAPRRSGFGDHFHKDSRKNSVKEADLKAISCGMF
jgi:hypothetical protein